MADQMKMVEKETAEASGKRRPCFGRRCLIRVCACFGYYPPDSEQCQQNRTTIVNDLVKRRQPVVDALQTVRNAFLIFSRVAPTLQRVGFCKSQVEYGKKLANYFATAAFCAKSISMARSDEASDACIPEETIDSETTADSAFSIIRSVCSPPLTETAIKTIETYLPENLELANDWPKFGPNWCLGM